MAQNNNNPNKPVRVVITFKDGTTQDLYDPEYVWTNMPNPTNPTPIWLRPSTPPTATTTPPKTEEELREEAGKVKAARAREGRTKKRQQRQELAKQLASADLSKVDPEKLKQILESNGVKL